MWSSVGGCGETIHSHSLSPSQSHRALGLKLLAYLPAHQDRRGGVRRDGQNGRRSIRRCGHKQETQRLSTAGKVVFFPPNLKLKGGREGLLQQLQTANQSGSYRPAAWWWPRSPGCTRCPRCRWWLSRGTGRTWTASTYKINHQRKKYNKIKSVSHSQLCLASCTPCCFI